MRWVDLAAAAAGAGARRRLARAVLFGATAATCAVIAVLGAASIGLAFLPAAVLAFVAARSTCTARS